MPTVAIGCFHERLPRLRSGCAVVAVDVIRAGTTAVTAAASGRRCYPVDTREAALALAARLSEPLVAGEVRGRLPDEFHVQNSPAELARRGDVHRPLVLLSSSGTRLMAQAAATRLTFLGTLRNHGALARALRARDADVVLLGAATRGDFRDEDQLCATWIANALLDAGFEFEDEVAASLVERWRSVPVEAIRGSSSADYLRRSGQERDLDFVLAHVDDVDDAFVVERGEVVRWQG